MTDSVAAWIAAGNQVTKCPTAFVAETRQARDLTPGQRAALTPAPKINARAVWNAMSGLTPRKAPQIHREAPKAPAAAGMAAPVPEAADSRPAPYLAESEVTTRVFSNGRSEVSTIDHQGRHYVSRFGPARNGMGNYQGTTFVNRAAFESCKVT